MKMLTVTRKQHLDRIILKTRLGRISLRHCRKAYGIAFRREMPEDMAFVDALFLAAEKVGDNRVANIIRAIDRIDGDMKLIEGWEA